MKHLKLIAAFGGLAAIAACATSPLSFEGVDKDNDGFAKIADVAKADSVATPAMLATFDTNGDALLDRAEFDSFFASSERQTAIAAAEEARRQVAAQRQISTPTRSSGGYGS